MAGETQLHHDHDRADQVHHVFGVAMRIKSAALAFVAVVVGLLAWLVLHLVLVVAQKQEIVLSGFAAFWLQHAPVILLMALPGVVVALLGAMSRRHHWLWMLLTLVSMLVPFGIALYCFIQVIGSMYRYQPL